MTERDRFRWRIWIWLAVLWAVGFGCGNGEQTRQAPAGDPQSGQIRQVSDEVLNALASRDGRTLAARVHPVRGVRFSPSAYVDVETDRVLDRATVERFWEDSGNYLWGYADGTGDEILLPPADYWQRYILSHDFRKATSVRINDDRSHGNTVNNAAQVYPKAMRVEYFLEPDRAEGQAEYDWAALRLVFENFEGEWYLVGVIHDQWSV
jgi:hypothetical protein